MLRRAGDPVTAIGTAAASGGDTDTVAAITGAIVGARYGLSRKARGPNMIETPAQERHVLATRPITH
ncbi:MAG: ADP-ribosylglycohydrolase family protein [Vulcanimicrobiaceae bacterium]